MPFAPGQKARMDCANLGDLSSLFTQPQACSRLLNELRRERQTWRANSQSQLIMRSPCP